MEMETSKRAVDVVAANQSLMVALSKLYVYGLSFVVER